MKQLFLFYLYSLANSTWLANKLKRVPRDIRTETKNRELTSVEEQVFHSMQQSHQSNKYSIDPTSPILPWLRKFESSAPWTPDNRDLSVNQFEERRDYQCRYSRQMFSLEYGLTTDECLAVDRWTVFGDIEETGSALRDAMEKIPAFAGTVVRPAFIDQSMLDKALTYDRTIPLEELVNGLGEAWNGNELDKVLSTYPMGHSHVRYDDRDDHPIRLVIQSRSGRWITPLKKPNQCNESEVLILESLSLGFRVMGKMISREVAVYFLVEVMEI